MKNDPFSVISDSRIVSVLRRLHDKADKQMPGLLLNYLPQLPRILLGGKVRFTEHQMHNYYADKYLALERNQAAFCYLTARAIKAKTIVEFGSSFGISTIWLATAVCDNGGGKVIGTEIVSEKAEMANKNIAEAGLSDYVEMRTGDALETLKDGPKQIDLLLNDGFPALALKIVELLTPRIIPGGIVLTDNVGTFKANYRDYVSYIRDSRNGFESMLLPFKSGTEYSIRKNG
ncbi:MAG: class I SAM-dependent methyltransferase [Pseudomonadota bacterium]